VAQLAFRVSPVVQDLLDSLVIREIQAHKAVPDRRDLEATLDQAGLLAIKEFLEQLEQPAHQDLKAREREEMWDRLDRPDLRVMQEIRVNQDALGTLVHLVV